MTRLRRPKGWTSTGFGTRTGSVRQRVAGLRQVDHGRIVDCGYEGGGLMGTTTVNLGAVRHRFQAVQLPDIQRPPEYGDGWVRFVQTCGGRTGVPAPRRVRRRPFVQWQAPLVWTTLSLTIHATVEPKDALVGASRFPRHWVYGADQWLSTSRVSPTSRTGTASPSASTRPGATRTPTPCPPSRRRSRHLSAQLMQGGANLRLERFPAGTVLFKQGERGTEVLLILDGIVRVEGRRAVGRVRAGCPPRRARPSRRRRSNIVHVAVTDCRVASVRAESSTARTSKSFRGASPRRSSARLTACGSPSAGPRVRHPRRARTTSASAATRPVWRLPTTREAPTLLLDAGTGLRRTRPAR